MSISQDQFDCCSSYDHQSFQFQGFSSIGYREETISCEKTFVEKKTVKKSINPSEAKNIPKNMGVLIKNYFVKHQPKIIRQNLVVSKFIKKAVDNKNYTRQDLKTLFLDEKARNICQQYLSSFQVIEDILRSEKIQDSSLHLKYVKKLFIGTYDPSTLSTLKYPQYQLV